jgi:hypothetical protein
MSSRESDDQPGRRHRRLEVARRADLAAWRHGADQRAIDAEHRLRRDEEHHATGTEAHGAPPQPARFAAGMAWQHPAAQPSPSASVAIAGAAYGTTRVAALVAGQKASQSARAANRRRGVVAFLKPGSPMQRRFGRAADPHLYPRRDDEFPDAGN